MNIHDLTPGSEIAKLFSSNIKDKVIIITGSNSGIGLQTAKILSFYGAKIILPCRTIEKAQKTVEEIKKTVPNADLVPLNMELDNLDSIRNFVKKFIAMEIPLHILINNAGISACPQSYTNDGFEMQFGVNHLGHFLLTLLLINKLNKNPSRVISLSSTANYFFAPTEGINFENLDAKKGYNPFHFYGISKLANILFIKELQRRVNSINADITCIAVHPGAIYTGIFRYVKITMLYTMFRSVTHLTAFLKEATSFKTLDQGCSTTIFCLGSPNIVKGEFYADNKIEEIRRHEKVDNIEISKKLWETSEIMTGEKFLS